MLCVMTRIHSILGFFFFQAEDGIRDIGVTGVQTCALPISFIRARARLSVYASSASTTDSSTPLTTTSTGMPAAFRRARRAGLAEARTRRYELSVTTRIHATSLGGWRRGSGCVSTHGVSPVLTWFLLRRRSSRRVRSPPRRRTAALMPVAMAAVLLLVGSVSGAAASVVGGVVVVV